MVTPPQEAKKCRAEKQHPALLPHKFCGQKPLDEEYAPVDEPLHRYALHQGRPLYRTAQVWRAADIQKCVPLLRQRTQAHDGNLPRRSRTTVSRTDSED